MVNDFISAAATSFVMRSVISSLDCSCSSGVSHSVNWTLEAYGFMGSMCWVRARRASRGSVSSRSWQGYSLSSGCGTVTIYVPRDPKGRIPPQTRDTRGRKRRRNASVVPKEADCVNSPRLDGRGDRFDPRCRSDVVDLTVKFRHRNILFGGLARLGAYQTLKISARQPTRYHSGSGPGHVSRVIRTMSYSTISTTAQLISKYSRAYSTNPAGSQNLDGEWQHFSNPVLKVVLDVKRSEAGDRLESFRLRVLWNMNPEGDAMNVDQREFVFVRRVSIVCDQ